MVIFLRLDTLVNKMGCCYDCPVCKIDMIDTPSRVARELPYSLYAHRHCGIYLVII